MPRHDWVQVGDTVLITIYLKNIARDDCRVEFEERRVTAFINTQGVEIPFIVDPLFDAVDTSKCSFKVTPYKVEIYLTPKHHTRWASLEASNAPGLQHPAPPVEPSSKCGKRKNWDEIGKALEADEDEKPNVEGFFKDVYAKADDDAKRAMMKSYLTSGGTVLSTDWKEVAHTNYEASLKPPAGQEVKKWV